MKKSNKTSAMSLAGQQSKDSYFTAQYKVCYKELFKVAQTMKMLSVASGIDRANICWHIAEMRKTGSIAIVKRSSCPITKHRANFYTTNPSLFPATSQLKLF